MALIFVPPGGIIAQLSNFFFFASGFFTDLLIIRICLVLANAFLAINAALGMPHWGSIKSTGLFFIDVFIWATVNTIFVHGPGLIECFHDERMISFETEEEEMLWRFFYRHTGLSKSQFKSSISPVLELKSYHKGERIPCSEHLYLILEGTVTADTFNLEKSTKSKIQMNSGEIFPLAHMYSSYTPRGMDFVHTELKAVADSTTVTAFQIPVIYVEAMSKNPKTKDAWTAILISKLGKLPVRQPKRNTSLASVDLNIKRGINKMFDPLHECEEPESTLAGSGMGLSHPIAHIVKYMKLSFVLPWPFGSYPSGLRHHLIPPTDPDDENDDAHHKKVARMMDEVSDGSQDFFKRVSTFAQSITRFSAQPFSRFSRFSRDGFSRGTMTSEELDFSRGFSRGSNDFSAPIEEEQEDEADEESALLTEKK